MTRLREIRSRDFDAIRGPLAALLVDAVSHGAPAGFLRPPGNLECHHWADALRTALDAGQRQLWIAERGDMLCGTVQLHLADAATDFNRASVCHLLVHHDTQRNGIGRMLMLALEARASELERGLLTLEAEAGSPAEAFCRALGYQLAGSLPEYACTPDGRWPDTALYFKTLFRRNPT